MIRSSISPRRVRAGRRALAWLVPCMLAVVPMEGVAQAQDPSVPPAQLPSSGQGLVSRAELETQAARLEGGSAEQRAEAAAIRTRLREGDFKVGDRILLSTTSSVALPAPLAEVLNSAQTVREGKVLRLTNLGDLSLAGVLRSELDSVVNAHVARSLRNVTVRAEPALQVMVTGPVRAPGFHSVAPDVTITDMLMSAAGPSSQADLSRMTVRRNGEEIIDSDSLNTAIRSGATLDRIAFQSGDEIVIPERKDRSLWRTILSVVGVASSIATIILVVDRINR